MGKEKFSALVEIKGGVATSFNTSISEAVSGVSRLTKKMGELSRQRAAIGRTLAGEANVKKLTGELVRAQQRLEETQRVMAGTDKPTRQMVAAFKKAGRDTQKLESALAKENDTLQKLRKSLSAAGVDTKNLSKEQARLEAQGRKVAATLKRQEAASQNMSNAKEGVGKWARAGVAVAGAGYMMAKPVQAAAEYQATEIDFTKFVQGADTEAGLKKVSDAVLAIGSKSVLGANGVGKLVSGYGKIGMAADDALEAAKATEILAVGLEMTADESSTLITKIMTGMKLSVKETLELGDAVNYIGDVTAADAKKTAEILQRQGALIKATSTLSNAQIVGLAAAFDQAAPNAESGATAMKNFMRGLSRGIATSKKGREAWKMIGMDPDQIARDMQKDGVGTMNKVLKGIAGVKGEHKDAVMSKIFGEESKGAIGFWLGNVDKFHQTMTSLDDKSKYLGRSAQEYARQMEGLNQKWAVFKNKLEVLQVRFGKALLPHVSVFLDKLGAGLERVFSLMDSHPELFQKLAVGAGAVFAVTSAVVGLGMALSVAKFALAGLNLGLANMAVKKLALGGAGAASFFSPKGWGVIFRGIAALLNPLKWVAGSVALLKGTLAVIGSIVGAIYSPAALVIGLLVAGGLAVYKYWEPIKAFFLGIKEGFLASFSPIEAGLKSLWSALGGSFDALTGKSGNFGKACDFVATKAKAVWKWIKELFTPISSTAEETKKASAAGKELGKTLAGRLGQALKRLSGWVKSGRESLKTLGEKMRAVGSALSTAMRPALEKVMPLLSKMFEALKKNWLPALGMLALSMGAPFIIAAAQIGAVLALIATMQAVIMRALAPVRDFVSGFVLGLVQALEPAGKLMVEIGGLVVKLCGELKQVALELWAEFDKASGASQALSLAWSFVVAIGKEMWASFKEGVAALFGVSGEFKSLSESGEGLGKSLGGFLMRNLKNLKTMLKVLIPAVKAFKNVFLKAFKQIGDFCNPIIDRINGAMVLTYLSMRKIFGGNDGEKEGAGVSQAQKAGGASAPSLPTAYKGALSARTTQTVHQKQEVHINVNGAQDPRETGLAVARALRASSGSELWDSALPSYA